ncbi:MAG: hypothetical protein ABSD13_03270 [Candidatus Korobacteraceae bacterium]|jgi:hypothetical protein
MQDFASLSLGYWSVFGWFANRMRSNQRYFLPMLCDLAPMTIWNDSPASEKMAGDVSSLRFVNLTGKLTQMDVAPSRS